MEKPPSVESKLELLLKKAAEESAEQYSKDSRFAHISSDIIKETASTRFDAIVDVARTQARAVAEVAQSQKNAYTEAAEIYQGDPHAEEIKHRMIARIEAVQNKMNQDTRLRIKELLTQHGVTEATADTLANEIFTQEAKIIQFPKKST